MIALEARPLSLLLRQPFRISYGASTSRCNVLAVLHDGAHTGYGEGALPPYYGITAEAALAYLADVHFEDLPTPPYVLDRLLDQIPAGPAPAQAAVDIALHDLWGRRMGYPLYQLWGLDPAMAPPSTYTLSIPEHLDDLPEQIAHTAAYPILKLKLGSGDPEQDEAIVRTARKSTDAALCVDANGGWSVEEALALIPRLAAYDLLFVEQPLAQRPLAAWHTLRRSLPAGMPPLIADESVQRNEDVIALAGAADGVNVKLAKAGGLRAARRQITLARALGMQVMVGCMIESGVAVTAAAHLAPLADYVDLDAGLHLRSDPFPGLRLHDDGRLELPDAPGLGITIRQADR